MRDNIVTAPVDDTSTVDLSEEWQSLLATHNYNYDIQYAAYAINRKPPGESDTGYHVCIIDTTSVPMDRADLVEDRITIPVCTCKASRFHHGPSDASVTIEDTDPCKHCRAAFKRFRAEADENQTELVQ